MSRAGCSFATRNVSHPGLVIRDTDLPELQLSANEAAEQLGVSHVTLGRVIRGCSTITAELANRFQADSRNTVCVANVHYLHRTLKL